MAVKVHTQMAEARAKGIAWDDIDNFLGEKQSKAAEAGFFPREITDFMGYGDPQRLRDQMAIEAAVNYAMAE